MVNITLHVLASILVYVLVGRMGASPSTPSSSIWDESTVAASIFAVHPVHTEAVANISGRAELLMSVFVLAALLHYQRCLQYGVFNKRNVVIFSSLVVLAVFSKEQGITVLWASYSHLWLINLRLLVLPYSLCFDYSMGCVPVVQSWTDFRALALPVVIAVVLATAYALLKTSDRLFRVGVTIGAITFLPASNLLVTVGFTIAERVLYLPSVGMCILMAKVFDMVQRRVRNAEKIFVAILVVAITMSYQRLEEWRQKAGLLREAG
ncbi:hypothetical protein COOONC_11533 [Cooperia oncophora]